MGLDFHVFYSKKSEGNYREMLNKWTYQDMEAHELCYGRKSWELVRALKCPTSDDCVGELDREDWINLMEILSYVGPWLDKIGDAYNKDEMLWTDVDKRCIALYEKWYNTYFDDYPTLGFEFSIGYMQAFWEQCDNVLEYLDDPDYDVWMLASY